MTPTLPLVLISLLHLFSYIQPSVVYFSPGIWHLNSIFPKLNNRFIIKQFSGFFFLQLTFWLIMPQPTYLSKPET